ncbi:MAG: tRNA pseudouridine synthase B (EC [uncultured Campylobacterales bacterium]|uniref:tRNA pseudouridine(55) synthase n=1 Tax=uncultured Campylobacterales bacterium TaxID=352960 RepID=A0A6S6SXU7_9BACT|nr:MAG: tRNA pseudouridine synthase B (EC [uncultured Campylobacterales bacterium]
MNKLFVTNKPAGLSSNQFLSRLKRKYGVKKAGFSGTLDPFARGSLIIAFGQYPKLFRFLKKSPKAYKATLWLGATSPTLDIEKIDNIKETPKLDIKTIKETLNSFLGELEYSSPKYSAKKQNGIPYYKLARTDTEFTPKTIKSQIQYIKLLNYTHPFIHFETTVSEGAYIRSIGTLIAQRLGISGVLSSLERVNEGEFYFQDEKELKPINYLNTTPNTYNSDTNNILLGKKLDINDFEIQEDGYYHLLIDNLLSIISINDGEVKYEINRLGI